LLSLGRITEDEARTHPKKNIMTRALGTEGHLQVDTGNTPIAPGTTVLICSDGLSNMVPDSDILDIMNRDANDDDKAGALVGLALENGGRDNISLILIN
jgi:protein phosphatase